MTGYADHDTIAAPASPPGRAPRGIVRVSGPRAIQITAALFRADSPPPLTECKPFRAIPGTLDLGDGVAAPARVYLFRAPRSYTAEDQCEIHTIGSPPLLGMVLDALLQHGARAAEPGEFTRRAFLNGRLALHQAEAVLRVIHAANGNDLKQAVAQLSGHVAGEIALLRDSLVEVTSRLELNIDFSDQDVEIVSTDEIVRAIGRAREEIDSIVSAQESVAFPEEGISVVIAGPPNAGKSTLFNALSETTATIVSDRPGTTRDAITGRATIDGIPFVLTDTAGLRPPNGAIDREAQRAAHAARRRAAWEIVVLDGAGESVPKEFAGATGEGRIMVVNKCDLARRLPAIPGAIGCSALTGEGVDAVRRALVAAVRRPAGGATQGHGFVPNARHRGALAGAADALAAAHDSAVGGMSAEFVAHDLRRAIDGLKEITGEITHDQILDRIFADFCLGK